MHWLLLSCFTGEGHNSAARALSEALERQGGSSCLLDPLSFRSNRAKQFVSSFYNGTIRHVPPAFGILYKAGALYDATGIRSPIYALNVKGAKRMVDFLRDEKFDAIVSTHLFGMETMTILRKRLGIQIPSYGVLTDYTPIPFLGETELDGYFIPHDDLTDSLFKKGLPKEKLIPTGIPISAAFSKPTERETARELLRLPKCKSMLVIMSGGIGGGNVEGLCRALLQAIDEETHVYVLTGRNEELRKRLQTHYEGEARLHAVPFTKEAALYMKAANILLSKPGGLSSTEAAVAGVPLIHVNAIPGCENANARFFREHGMSLYAENPKAAARLCIELLHNHTTAERMQTMQRRTIRPDAADEIVRLVSES